MCERTIVDYKVVSDYSLIVGDKYLSLTEEVKYWMEQGWQPFGGIGSHSSLHQAMVKYE